MVSMYTEEKAVILALVLNDDTLDGGVCMRGQVERVYMRSKRRSVGGKD